MKNYFKKIFASLLIISLLIPIFFNKESYASGETIFNVRCDGEFQSVSKNEILKEINRIRKEACDENMKLSNGKVLHSSDYVPLKWSREFEKYSSIRSVEASIHMEHTRPNGKDCSTVSNGKFSYTGENLAWNSFGLMAGINQFYLEKAELIKKNNGQNHRVTGHYENLINPNFTHIGVTSFKLNGANFYTTQTFLGKNKNDSNENYTLSNSVTVEISNNLVRKKIFNIKNTLLKEKEFNLGIFAYLKPSEFGNKNIFFISHRVIFTSSDESVAKIVDKNKLKTLKTGKTVITANIDGEILKLNLTVVENLGSWKKNDIGWWYEYTDGTYISNQWEKIYDDWYYFDSNGYMAENRYVDGYFVGDDGKRANGWYDDGFDWYFFKDGKKLTGFGTDGNGKRYFANGKYANGIYDGTSYKDGVDSTRLSYVNGIFYDENKKAANWWYDDGTDWYFFKDGKKLTGFGTDGNGKMLFKNGKYKTGYENKIFYQDGKLCNWWCDDGSDWYFFQNGKKHNGFGTDASGKRYFHNGKYANGTFEGNLYKDGLDANTLTYVNGIFYDENKKVANWWYDDGTDWYFFKDGKKHTGFATDGNGKMLFKNGKYKTGYENKIFYQDGKLCNWWCDDGSDWYFFQNGKKHNGFGTDASGKRYFHNGKYANGTFEGNLYKDGLDANTLTYVNGIFYDENKKAANWWYDDGTDWYFFKDGKKHTGFATDGNGKRYFVNGKYANGVFNGKFYSDGVEGYVPSSAMINERINVFDFDKYKYYTGCWLLSAASGLYSKGVEINPDSLLEKLKNTGNPETGVMGDPSTHGYMGVFPASYPSALLPVLKNLLPSTANITGASLDNIKFEISRGNPVQVWFSRVEPTTMKNGDETFEVSSDYHSMLLRGYDESGFYAVESYGNTSLSLVPYNSYHWRYDHFTDAYNRFGKKAIVYR